ncbi:MAG: cysteine peptidase family C39 domain-containing protein [Desulfuromonadales bacterium]
MTGFYRFGALLAVTALLGACSPLRAPEAGNLVVSLDVPYYEQQRRDDCASAALASALAYANAPVPPAQIDEAVYDPRLDGALLADLENFSRELGMETRSGRGNLETLRGIVREGHPVIIPIDMGWGPLRRPHYLVIFGYGKSDFAAHAGTRADIRITAEELQSRWRRMGRLYLYVKG